MASRQCDLQYTETDIDDLPEWKDAEYDKHLPPMPLRTGEPFPDAYPDEWAMLRHYKIHSSVYQSKAAYYQHIADGKTEAERLQQGRMPFDYDNSGWTISNRDLDTDMESDESSELSDLPEDDPVFQDAVDTYTTINDEID